MVGERDVLFLKHHCQGESLDIGWSSRANRDIISSSVYNKCKVCFATYRSMEPVVKELHELKLKRYKNTPLSEFTYYIIR